LEAHGIARAYCVPGESYLAVLDALHDSTVKTIVCRHESGAGFMAVAEAKMTGRPTVFMVSRGPGATNGSIAVHGAEQDALPVSPYPVALPRHAAEDVAALQSLIDAAARPIVVAGALLRGARGAQALARFAEAQRTPVAVTWKNQDVFDNGSPLYAGHIAFG